MDMDEGASPKKTGQNACTQKYAPTTGGYSGSEIESAGGAGEIAGVELSPAPTDPSGAGNYNPVVNSHGNYPHSGPNPDNLEGAPIGSTPEDPTRAQY